MFATPTFKHEYVVFATRASLYWLENHQTMSQKRKRSASPSPTDDIFRSSPIEDRTSTFIAYFSPTLKPKELQNIDEIKSASHKVLAWRKESNQQSINGSTKFSTSSDDDGEKWAG